jgi:hypothetical protein
MGTPVLSVFLFGGNLRIKPPLRGGDFLEDGLNGFSNGVFGFWVGNLDVSGEEE